jgi:beta-glucanase (GH16 family)
MKKLIILLALLVSQSAVAWQLTFSDEFNSQTIDVTKWQTKDQWGLETYSGGGVQEQQCYKDSALSVLNGSLVITAKPKTFSACSGSIDVTKNIYESGRITSYSKFSQAYGYFESRMMFPDGQGIWPAWWIVGYPPEIDIMEWVAKDPLNTHHTLHSAALTKGFSYSKATSFANEWHIYAVDWQPGLIVWYVDNKEVARLADATNIPSGPMYMLINLAIGGSWPGSADPFTMKQMQIDYVRVYKRDSATELAPAKIATPVDFVKLSASLRAAQNQLSAIRKQLDDALIK